MRALMLVVLLAAAVGRAESSTPSAEARAAAQAGAGLTFGVGIPFAVYGVATATKSIEGFIVGVGGGTLLAPVLGVAAVHLTGRWLGGTGGLGWAILGGAIGLVGGIGVGLPLLQLRSQAYLLGLLSWWLMPAVGAWLGSVLSSRGSAASPARSAFFVVPYASTDGVGVAGLF